MIGKHFFSHGQESEEHWVSISDVMAGLMVIFLFIAISYMLNIQMKMKQIEEQNEKIREQNKEIQELHNIYKNLKEQLAKDLEIEFEGDPDKRKQFHEKWEGYLNMDTLTIGFKQPFQVGGEIVPKGFKEVLTDFFPRYTAVLTKAEYKAEIEEIRIEGHTSSEWLDEVPIDVAFMNNMELSQNRARNVLDYVLEIDNPQIFENKIWLKKKVTANGLSSSHLVLYSVVKLSSQPTNSYKIIAEETELPEMIVKRLHRELLHATSNWQKSKHITEADIINAVSQAHMSFQIQPERLERTINLLRENREASRRVEFRVVTKSEKVIERVKQLMEKFHESSSP